MNQKIYSASTVAEQKPAVTVWHNPDPLSRFGNATRRYNALTRLYLRKLEELDTICGEMKQCASLMNREFRSAGRHVKLV